MKINLIEKFKVKYLKLVGIAIFRFFDNYLEVAVPFLSNKRYGTWIQQGLDDEGFIVGINESHTIILIQKIKGKI